MLSPSKKVQFAHEDQIALAPSDDELLYLEDDELTELNNILQISEQPDIEEEEEKDDLCNTFNRINDFFSKTDEKVKQITITNANEEEKVLDFIDDEDIDFDDLDEALWSEVQSHLSNIEKSKRHSKVRKSYEGMGIDESDEYAS